MRRLFNTRNAFMGILTGVVFCALSAAQVTTSPVESSQEQPVTRPAPNRLRIAPGSVIPVQLERTVDAKKAKSGAEVDAKVTQDMKGSNGEVLVPKDTKIVGHVTEAEARSKEQKESELGISFNQAVMKDGSAASLPMSIQAVIAPRNPDNASNAEDRGAPPPEATGAGSPSGSPGTRGGMGAQQPTSAYPPAPEEPSNDTRQNAAQPNITPQTQGVVGIPHYELENHQSPSQGSVIRSEKDNVKLESGTMLLLRVNQ